MLCAHVFVNYEFVRQIIYERFIIYKRVRTYLKMFVDPIYKKNL